MAIEIGHAGLASLFLLWLGMFSSIAPKAAYLGCVCSVKVPSIYAAFAPWVLAVRSFVQEVPLSLEMQTAFPKKGKSERVTHWTAKKGWNV